MTYEIVFSSQFKKDLKRIAKQKKDLLLLNEVVDMLASGDTLPVRYRDHALTNYKNYGGARECHIKPDWLLIYEKQDTDLTLLLIRTGTHSKLLNK